MSQEAKNVVPGKKAVLNIDIKCGPTILPDQTKGTVFSKTYALLVVDEVHEARSEGYLNAGLHLLRLRSGACLFLSATPLYNGIKVTAF